MRGRGISQDEGERGAASGEREAVLVVEPGGRFTRRRGERGGRGGSVFSAFSATPRELLFPWDGDGPPLRAARRVSRRCPATRRFRLRDRADSEAARHVARLQFADL